MASIRLIVYSTLAVAMLNIAMVTSNTFHYHMSGDDLRRVFHVDRHDQVPEYEIVHVHSAGQTNEPPTTEQPIDSVTNSGPTNPSDNPSADDSLRKQSATKKPTYKKLDDVKHLRLSAFGKDMKLKLKKASGLFKGESLKMWAVDNNATEPHQLQYTELDEDDGDIGEIYQDEDNMAALLLQLEDGGALAVEGTIGHQLVVKPVPSGLRHHLPAAAPVDDEMFLDDEGEEIEDDVSMDTGRRLQRRRTRRQAAVETQQHIVFKRNLAADGEQGESDYAFMEPDQLNQKYRTKRSISKREAPYVIYPEILVIVDYDGYRLHGGDNVQIKRYFVSFWNGVDLRYKLLKGPKIRISIAGIIISRGRDATPYLERNRVGRDAIDSAAALTDMGKYLFRERRLPVYDIAVAVTKLDMCRRQYATDTCNRGTAGFAYVGGACVVNKRLEKVNSVAIIEDTGGFSGIIVGAHEVGHLLGAVHDGSPPPSYLGGPGAEKCRWEDGFIMSDLRHTEKGFKWSACSVISFHHFLNGDTATCLFNSPHEDESLPRVLPGKLLTLDAQCRKDRGTSACFKDDRVCAQLFCFDAGSGYCVAYRPAAEGSTCGDGQYCINGRCTTEHENIIPDYSQNTPTYVRRNDADTSATQSRPIYASLTNTTTQRYNWHEDKTTNALSTTTQPPVTSQPKTTAKYFFKLNFYQNTKTPYTVAQTTNNPYTVSQTTPSPYVYSPTTKNPYVYTQTTKSPYASQTTKNPYTLSQTTKNPYIASEATYNPYTNQKTTKNPYTYQKTTKNPYTTSQSTPNPYIASEITKTPYQPKTTKTPYTVSQTTPNAYKFSQTTKNPYTKPNPYIISQTTKNPYAPTQTTKSPYTTTQTTTPIYIVSETTTPDPLLEVYNPNAFTTKTPFKFYKMVTTKNPYDFSNFHQTHSKVPPKSQTTTKNPYYEYFKDLTTQTTKKPYDSFVTAKKNNYNYNNYNQFYAPTTAVPYALSITKPTPKYNPYVISQTTKKIPTVDRNNYETSATRNTEYRVKANDTETVIADNADATKCVDSATNIGGSMTCSDFLQRYGFQYCQYRYMKRNCCASHRSICESQVTS